MSNDFLPYGRQWIDDDDIAAVSAALQSDYLTTGPEIDKFEQAFRTEVDAPHALACHSATAALHMAYEGLGLGPGDVAIIPSVTFLATANAARYCGADVVFADVDPDTGLITPDSLDRALEQSGGRARLVAPVHLGGVMCDMEGLSDVARGAGLKIVEDSCHALGSRDETGQPAGACVYSDAASFSFHPVKTLACGEGGMVTTRDAGLAEHMARTRTHGVERKSEQFVRAEGADEPWWYEMQALGWNYRMPDINAALGRSQLKKLAMFAARRRALTARYDELLQDLGPHLCPPKGRDGVDACRHLYSVRIDFEALGVNRASVMQRMRAQGVGTQVHYIPVHTQPYYTQLYGKTDLPGASHYYARTLTLPLYPAMPDDGPERTVAALKEAIKP